MYWGGSKCFLRAPESRDGRGQHHQLTCKSDLFGIHAGGRSKGLASTMAVSSLGKCVDEGGISRAGALSPFSVGPTRKGPEKQGRMQKGKRNRTQSNDV